MTDSKKILKKLNVPQSSYIERDFPFKVLSKTMTSKEKKQFSKDVESRGVRLLAVLKRETSNVLPYEDERVRYEEVHIFQVKLFSGREAAMKRVYHVLSSKIPYPLIIRFITETENETSWVAATHRKSLKDQNLLMEELYFAHTNEKEEDFLERINFEKLNRHTLKDIYESIIREINAFTLTTQYKVNVDEKDMSNEEIIESLDQLKQLDEEIEKYVNLAKKEQQLNRRIEYQMKATELKNKKSDILKKSKLP